MAISSAQLSAQEIADASADKTLLAAANACTLGAGWRWVEEGGGTDAEGTIADADRTDPDYPTRRAIDRLGNLWTRPTEIESASSSFSLIGRIDPAKEFDTALIGWSHNFYDCAVLTVYLDIASQANFSDAIRIASWLDPGNNTIITAGNRRLVSLSLKHTGTVALRYTGAAYFRLYFPGTGSDFAEMPSLGEVMLLRRRQLRHCPRRPYDEDERESLVVDVESTSGIRQRYVRYTGRALRRGSWLPGTDDIASIRALYTTDSEHGTLPVVWIDKPASEPSKALVGFIEPALAMPLAADAPLNRDVTLSFAENAPFCAREE